MDNSYNLKFEQTYKFFSEGHIDKAFELANQLQKNYPERGEIYNLLSRINYIKNNIFQAINYAEKSLKLEPQNYFYYLNLAELYSRSGNIEGCIQCLKKSLIINPNLNEAKYNLANIYKNMENFQEAEVLYKELININPNDYQSLNNLGNLYLNTSEYQRAVESFYNALRSYPDSFQISANLAKAFLEMKNYYQAEYYYKNTLFLKPDHIESLKALSVLSEISGKFDNSISFYKKYIACSNNKSYLSTKARNLHLDMMIPWFDLSNSQIDFNRKNLIEKIDKYIPFGEDNSFEFISENIHVNTQLIYHGRDNKEIKKKYSEVFEKSFPEYQVNFNKGRIKIGFFVSENKEGIFAIFMKNIINSLPANDFETLIICSDKSWIKLSEYVNKQSVRHLAISRKIEEISKVILESKLDIFYNWEIGTDLYNYFIAYYRLAPVQCTTIGWPDTTGLKNIDYFISSELIETETAQDNYTEKLVMLKNLPFNYSKPVVAEKLNSIEDFGLSKKNNIYFCAQNLSKLHPDFDYIIAGILRKDPKGLIVFVIPEHEYIAELLKIRLRINYADITNRVVFLERLSFNKYLNLLTFADVILDTLYFGGANTSYEAFAMNAPVVTFPWTHERGRYTLGCYKQMGIDGLVAKSFEEYIALAIKAANDKEFRNEIVKQIKGNNHKLFDDNDVTQEYIDFFRKVTRPVL